MFQHRFTSRLALTLLTLNPFTHISKTRLKTMLSTSIVIGLLSAASVAYAKKETKNHVSKKPSVIASKTKTNSKPKHNTTITVVKTPHKQRSFKTAQSSIKLPHSFKSNLGTHSYRRQANYTVPSIPTSIATLNGLNTTHDPLSLKASVAFVVDSNTGEVLFDKNSTTALPIASITKLMTALVVVEAKQDLNEILSIDEPDLQLEKKVRSRLGFGTQMPRRVALQLALMSSENRAANMLTRYYPGGKSGFVDAMNKKALELGMHQSYFVEGTGLASANMASAQDLVKLMKAASQHPLIRELSTQSHLTLTSPTTGHELLFKNTNRLVEQPDWDILLQKTGFINAAGQCLIMHTNINNRSVMMVFLDSASKASRLNDATRVRNWLVEQHANAAILNNKAGI